MRQQKKKVSELEDKAIESIQNEVENKDSQNKNNQKRGIGELWNNFKWPSICLTGVLKREERYWGR